MEVMDKAKSRALDAIIRHLRQIIAKQGGDESAVDDLVNPEEAQDLENVEGHMQTEDEMGKHLSVKDEEDEAIQEEFAEFMNRGSRSRSGKQMGYDYMESKRRPEEKPYRAKRKKGKR